MSIKAETKAEEILEYNGYEISELSDAGTILFYNPDYSTAIIGMSSENQVVYDYEKMIKYLVSEEGMTEEDAADYICYNTIRALSYIDGVKPVILFPFEETC